MPIEASPAALVVPNAGSKNAGARLQKASLETGAPGNTQPPDRTHALRGKASWYGPGFHGKKTASGEIYDQTKLTAAHRTLPLGSRARVINLENGKSVEVEINDRGPYIDGRVLDLSHAAAKVLGFVEAGIVSIQMELLNEPSEISAAR